MELPCGCTHRDADATFHDDDDVEASIVGAALHLASLVSSKLRKRQVCKAGALRQLTSQDLQRLDLPSVEDVLLTWCSERGRLADAVGNAPSDVWLQVFEHLDGPSLCRAREVCRLFSSIAFQGTRFQAVGWRRTNFPVAQLVPRLVFVQHLKLSNMRLNHAQVLELAQCVRDSTFLRVLELDGSAPTPGFIDDCGATALGRALEENDTLTTLDLAHNKIAGAGAVALAASLVHNRALRHLDLSCNVVRPSEDGADALAEALQKNGGLVSLDMSNNAAGMAVASALFQALCTTGRPAGVVKSVLQHVRLAANAVGPDGAAAVCKYLRTNYSVQTLDLSQNFIGSKGGVHIGRGLAHGGVPLHTLLLQDNLLGPDGVTAVAEVLGGVRSLVALDLSTNGATCEGLSAVSSVLPSLPRLRTFKFSNNSAEESGARGLAAVLVDCTSLTSLDVSSNHFGRKGCTSLLKALSLCTTTLVELDMTECSAGDGLLSLAPMASNPLTALTLSNNGCSAHVMSSFGPLMHNAAALTRLDMSFNNFGVDASSLGASLASCTSLVELNVSRCSLSRDGGVRFFKCLLHSTSSLTALYMAGNALADHGAQAVAEALKNNSRLRTIDLANNRIGVEGCQALAESMSTWTASEGVDVDLRSNWVAADGAVAVAELLGAGTVLRALNLASNDIASEGASALGLALSANSTLQRLVLSRNGVGDDGVTCIADGLQCNSALASLDLAGNDLGRSGCAALAGALAKHRPALRHLSVKGCFIQDAGVTNLAEGLLTNKRLESLDLRACGAGRAACDLLAECLARNDSLGRLDLRQCAERGAVDKLRRVAARRCVQVLA